jgi:hypothetical protein
MGICALCGITATLRDSHYLPAAFFRRLHGQEGGNTLPPIWLNAERAMYYCKQAQTKLLCDTCEHRFKVQGEDWLTECTYQKDGRFPLRDLLLQSTPFGRVGQPPRANIYTGNRIPGLRHAEITYFAASVFWRGWAIDWSRISDVPQLDLPQGLGIEFRDFLLGKSPFPSSVVLTVEVALNPLLGMVFPQKLKPRKPNANLKNAGYFFVVFGITFSLYLDPGKTDGLRGKATSIAEPPHPIFLTDVRMWEVHAGRETLESTAKRVGRLARSSIRD